MGSGEAEEENERNRRTKVDGWTRERPRERLEINSKLTESAYDALPLRLSSPLSLPLPPPLLHALVS